MAPHTRFLTVPGISVLALWSLSANPAFPQPTGNDADGNVLWNTPDITAFVAQHRAAIANGWKISTASLPSFNFAYAPRTRPSYPPALSTRCMRATSQPPTSNSTGPLRRTSSASLDPSPLFSVSCNLRCVCGPQPVSLDR